MSIWNLFGGSGSGSSSGPDDYNLSTADCVDLAKEYGVETSVNTVIWLINNKHVEGKKFSSVWVVSRSSFLKWVNKKVAEAS